MQANHKFGENNAVLVTAFHPLLGKVGAVVVTQDMEAGEEVKSPSNLTGRRGQSGIIMCPR